MKPFTERVTSLSDITPSRHLVLVVSLNLLSLRNAYELLGHSASVLLTTIYPMTNSPSPVGSPRTISTACYSTSLSSRIDPDTHQPCRRQILAASITAVLAQSLSLLGPAAQAASGITDDELREIVHLAFEKTAGKSKACIISISIYSIKAFLL